MSDYKDVLEGVLTTSESLLRDLFHHVVHPLEEDPKTSTRPDNVNIDIGIYITYTIICLFIILSLRHLILNPLAKMVVQNERDVGKFGDSGTEFVLYGVFTVVGLSCLLSEPWLWPSTDWWPIEQATMTNALRCWYLLDAGRYTASLISLICFEHKRKDFTQMFVHHIVTVVITLISYQTDFNRVGAIVKLLMDPADVPVSRLSCFCC